MKEEGNPDRHPSTHPIQSESNPSAINATEFLSPQHIRHSISCTHFIKKKGKKKNKGKRQRENATVIEGKSNPQGDKPQW